MRPPILVYLYNGDGGIEYHYENDMQERDIPRNDATTQEDDHLSPILWRQCIILR